MHLIYQVQAANRVARQPRLVAREDMPVKKDLGDRTIDGIKVTVDAQALDAHLGIKSICDDGFEWGFDGAASRQLALALLADHLDDDALALRL